MRRKLSIVALLVTAAAAVATSMKEVGSGIHASGSADGPAFTANASYRVDFTADLPGDFAPSDVASSVYVQLETGAMTTGSVHWQLMSCDFATSYIDQTVNAGETSGGASAEGIFDDCLPGAPCDAALCFEATSDAEGASIGWSVDADLTLTDDPDLDPADWTEVPITVSITAQ